MPSYIERQKEHFTYEGFDHSENTVAFASANGVMILSSLGITVFLVFAGLIMFNRNEQTFIDVV